MSTIRRREGAEIPVREIEGVHYLDRHALVSMQRQGVAVPSTPGERTALAFRLLRDGASPLELSIALRFTVGEVDQLQQDFLRLQTPTTVLPSELRERLAEHGIEARNIVELVDVTLALAARTQRRGAR